MRHNFEVKLDNNSPEAKPKDFYTGRGTYNRTNWKQALRDGIKAIKEQGKKSGRWTRITIEITRLD